MKTLQLNEISAQRLCDLALAQGKAPEFVLADLIQRAFDAPGQLGIPATFPCSNHTTAPTVEAV